MKVTLAFLLCLVTLAMGAPSSADQQVRGLAMMENRPDDVTAIESAEYAQPSEENDAMDTSATHHKRFYYSHYYPHYYSHYYPRYHYPGYYNYYY